MNAQRQREQKEERHQKEDPKDGQRHKGAEGHGLKGCSQHV